MASILWTPFFLWVAYAILPSTAAVTTLWNETAVSLDATIHLPCAVAIDPQDTDVIAMAWYKRQTTIWEDRSYFTSERWDSSKYDLINTYDLLINNVSFRDAGEYRCVRTNLETDERVVNKWTVHVLGHPKCHVSSPEGVNYIREGHNVSLTCNLRFAGSARNRPNVTWQTAAESATLGDTLPPGADNTVRSLLNITVTKGDKNRE